MLFLRDTTTVWLDSKSNPSQMDYVYHESINKFSLSFQNNWTRYNQLITLVKTNVSCTISQQTQLKILAFRQAENLLN